MSVRNWEAIDEGVYRFTGAESCTVYAVRGPDGLVLVNAGTGRATEALDELRPFGSLTVLLTHHFRDHSDGARRLHAEAGATVLGNYGDGAYYVDPEQHFRERQTWNSYDNRWDRFSPLRPIPVTDWMRDYETREIAGLRWETVPTPGMTNGASSYVVTLPESGRRLAFVGEVICSAEGRTSRLAPLQYDYNDLGGATNLWHSCTRLLEAAPDRLLPSRGGGPIDDPAAAISAFKANLRRIDEIIPGFAAGLKELGDESDDTDEVLPRLLLSRHGEAKTHFIVSRAGDRVLALDYGYHSTAAVFPAVHHRSNRRPLLHGMKGLKRRWGVDRIDTVLVSHYHDDHVNGIPLLQRLWGTEVWAADHFADILRRPERYDRPCLWHEPIDVTRALPCGETFHWDDVAITLHPMSGHTRFSSLLCLEIDGTRVVHTGDQIFFDPWEFAPGARLFTNHVYKNGLDLGCYGQTLDHLRRFRPEVVLTGHTQPYRTTDEWYNVIARGAQAFDDVHRLLQPLGDDEVHFGPESQGGKLKPYRAHLPDVPGGGGARIPFDGWVLNPFPTEQPASVRLVAPEGWESEPLEVTLGPREQQEIRLSLAVPAGTRCRRQPVGLDLTVGGQPFGQVAEALVTAGMPHF